LSLGSDMAPPQERGQKGKKIFFFISRPNVKTFGMEHSNDNDLALKCHRFTY